MGNCWSTEMFCKMFVHGCSTKSLSLGNCCHTVVPAGLAAVVWPVHGRTGFWGRKNGVTWIPTYECITEWPLRVVHCSLGHLRSLLRTFSSLQPSKVVTRNWSFSIFCGDTWAWGERANWGGANMHIVHGSHFWQLDSITFLATQTTGEVILVAFWKIWPQKRSQIA